MQKQKTYLSLMLAISSLLIGLVLCEAALQILYRLNPDFVIKKHGGGNHPQHLIVSSPPLTYAPTPNFHGRMKNPYGDFDEAVDVNAYGFRDTDEPHAKDAISIMAIGDSIVFGEGVKLEETFLAILESNLQEDFGTKLNVIKAGVPGYSEKQALDLLEEKYEFFKPFLVILAVTAGEAWRNQTGYVNEQGFIVDARLSGTYTVFDHKLYHSNTMNPLLGYLDNWQKAHFLLPTFIKQRRKYIKGRFFKKPETEIVSMNTPVDDQLNLSSTFEQMHRFRSISQTMHFTPVILSKGFSVPASAEIVEEAERLGMSVLDLAPLFQVGNGKISFSFPHDGHWNASTHRMVGELLYKFIVQEKLIEQHANLEKSVI